MTKDSLFRACAILALSFVMTGLIYAQDTKTTTTTVTKKEVVQNPDGTYTVIEYPVGKEVTVELTPFEIKGAKGFAKVMRAADGTTIAVDLAGLPVDAKNYYIYAVDPTGAVTLLGPTVITNGVSKATFTTPMDKFMLVLSPNEGLTEYVATTPYVFRSAVPTGYAVVPVTVTSSAETKPVAVTTKTEVVQNPDGTYTIIEYPVGKELTVELTPINLQGAKGWAKVTRAADGTTIAVDVTGLPADTKSYYVYTVDPTGAVTLLGPTMIETGTGKATFTTKMDKFMLVLSPNEALTAFDTTTPVVFRSAVPTGYAVVPVAVTSSGGAKQVAVTTPVTSTYDVPMLNVPAFTDKTGEVRINFTGELSGLKGKAYVQPKKGKATHVKMKFDDMNQVPKEKRFILWAVSPDGKYTKLGQVTNRGSKDDSEIMSDVNLTDFGLFITVEDTDVTIPTGTVYSVFQIP